MELAKEILGIIEEKKGSDILILDISTVSLLADYFVICTAETERQTEAMVDAIMPVVKDSGRRARVEGESNSGWVLLDCGDVIVHVFSPVLRDYYALEKLWKDAKVVVRVQ